jgi:AhpD family alkylhydroperoxidase
MKKMMMLAAAMLFPAFAHADKPVPNAEAAATYADIQKTLGLVPSFLKAVPEDGVAGVWLELKSVELNPQTAIPNKYKELIGLAVAAQVPCHYCIYFHTETSKANGASDAERKEAIAIAGLTRHWSAFLNGMHIDVAQFNADLTEVMASLKAGKPKGGAPTPTDAASTYADIEASLGSVPRFFKAFPEAGITGAWRAFKGIELNAKSAVPGKYKELMGLAVAAQIPCQYCVEFHTQAAKLMGATDAELKEAVAVSGIVRELSAIANGNQVDMQAFKKEVQQILAPKPSAKVARGD